MPGALYHRPTSHGIDVRPVDAVREIL